MREIKLHPTAVVAFCLLLYMDPWGLFFPFLLAALAHELGHVVAVWASGGQVCAVSADGKGARITASALSYRAELLCTLAGPGVNVVLFFAASRKFPMFGLMNLILAAYNLIPVEPLDGGTILRCLLLMFLQPDQQQRISRTVSIAVLSMSLCAAVWCCFWLHTGIWPLLLVLVVLVRIPKENGVAKDCLVA